MKDSDKIGIRARNIQDIYRSNDQFRKCLSLFSQSTCPKPNFLIPLFLV